MKRDPFIMISLHLWHHPKVLELSSDQSRWGWIVLLSQAKPLGGSFASEVQLRELMGARYKYVDEYRAAGLLDGLDVHDWDDAQRDPDSNARDRARRYRDKKRDASRDASREDAAGASRDGHSALARVHETENETYTETGVNPLAPAVQGRVDLVFAAWKEAAKKNGATVLGPKRRRKILAALKDYPLDDVLDAVRGWQNSPYHCGQNDTGTVYNELTTVLRDGGQVEKFRDLWRSGGTLPTNDVDRQVASLIGGRGYGALE